MDIETTNQQSPNGFDRRSFIKRSALVGATAVWVAPTVQSMVAPAFAVGTPAGGCTACLTGGGAEIENVTYNGNTIRSLTLGTGQICCEGSGPFTLQINAHLEQGNSNDVSWHFTELLTLTCTKTGNPAPPPGTQDCANRFTGTAQDDEGNTISFVFEDNGEPGTDVDFISVDISGPNGTLSAQGTLTGGNLQVHEGLGPITRDCSGC